VALTLVGVALIVIVGNLGLSIIREATQAFASAAALNGSSSQPATPGSVFISPLNNGAGSPTPTASTFTVGVWTSDANPAGGSVNAFVRVSNNSAPVARVRVYLQVSDGGGGYRVGPLTTDANGLARTRITFAAGRGSPIFLTATVTIGGVTYEGDYTFVAG
jgi:hypothetical protein